MTRPTLSLILLLCTTPGFADPQKKEEPNREQPQQAPPQIYVTVHIGQNIAGSSNNTTSADNQQRVQTAEDEEPKNLLNAFRKSFREQAKLGAALVYAITGWRHDNEKQ